MSTYKDKYIKYKKKYFSLKYGGNNNNKEYPNKYEKKEEEEEQNIISEANKYENEEEEKKEEEKEEEKKEEENIIPEPNNIILNQKNNISPFEEYNIDNYLKLKKKETNLEIKNVIDNLGNLENFINNLGLGESLKKKIVEHFKTLSNLLKQYKNNKKKLTNILVEILNISTEHISKLLLALENLEKKTSEKNE